MLNDIPGYEVSEDGRVWSFWSKNGELKSSPKLIRPETMRAGHKRVRLRTSKGIYKHVCVHQLVMRAFVGPVPTGQEVRHLDGNLANNHLKNLCYGTRRDNEEDKKRHGTHQTGEGNPAAKLTTADVRAIRNLKKVLPARGSNIALAAMFGVSTGTIKHVARKRRWSHVVDLTNHQIRALRHIANTPIGILSGPPGCGKTTAVAAYIKDLQSKNGHGGIAVAAPTGRAARRMSESLRSHGIELDATTIHRLLAYSYADGHGYFAHNRTNPLPFTHVFIDESSMVDVALMASLLGARRRGSRLLFIGDPHQLSPVGHGAPLRDMIEMRLPHGHLTEIHRNAGRIVRCCKSIVEEQRWESSPHGFDVEHGENLFVDNHWKGSDAQILAVKDWLKPDSSLFDSCTDPVDLIWDCQVIVPLNAKSKVSRKPLNRILQSHLNPAGRQVEGNPFRINDKIVCGKNGWYPAAHGCPPDEVNDDGKVYCANGEQAKVIDNDPRWTIAELALPTRIVRISASRAADEDGGKWDLAFAISCHRAQGCEWPFVIVVADESNGARWLCDRHWLLTAISRASTACVCVGKQPALQELVMKSHLWKRRTYAVQKYFELLVTS